jgi:hypothetical protein
MHDCGLRVVFAPQARGWHYAHRSFASWLLGIAAFRAHIADHTPRA